MTLAGGVTGTLVATLGWAVDEVAPDATVPLAVALGLVSLLYALHEVGLIRIPVPGRDWQVPVEWVSGGFYRSAIAFGAIVGFGIFTRVTYAIFPVLLAWLFVSGDVLVGLVGGLLYGGFRALGIYLSANTKAPEDVIAVNQRLMAIAPSLHAVVGVALAAFGVFLTVAPLI
jgi:hypothetical protein